jgi:hypothetical protein
VSVAPGPGDPSCPHVARDERGVCLACGHCLHDVILNGACLYCGATDFPPPTHKPAVIPLDRLKKR